MESDDRVTYFANPDTITALTQHSQLAVQRLAAAYSFDREENQLNHDIAAQNDGSPLQLAIQQIRRRHELGSNGYSHVAAAQMSRQGLFARIERSTNDMPIRRDDNGLQVAARWSVSPGVLVRSKDNDILHPDAEIFIYEGLERCKIAASLILGLSPSQAEIIRDTADHYAGINY